MELKLSTDENKSEFLSSLTAAAKEAKRIAAGEEPAQTLDELLDEEKDYGGGARVITL